MVALGAVRSGAGLVTVATDKENISALHSRLPEAMAFDLGDKQLLEQQLQKASVVLVGPGLVDDERGESFSKQSLIIQIKIRPSYWMVAPIYFSEG